MTRRRGALVSSLACAALGLGAAGALATGASGPAQTTGASGASGASAPAKVRTVSCPATISSAGASSAQWLWSNYGKPASSATKVSYSQSGGSGSWVSGAAKGTICSQDQGGGEPRRSIVIKVSGASKLTPNTTELGLPGIAITLMMTVTKSGDTAVCPVGSTGSAKLFASYYSVHDDRASLTFTGTCAAWSETFAGAHLHVEISNHGHEIK